MDDFDLGDFLSAAGGAYSAYQSGQNTNTANDTAAKNLAAQQALLANNSAMSSQTKTYLVIGGGILIAIIAVVLIFRRK